MNDWSNQPDGFSPLENKYLVERWNLSLGMLTKTSVDTLLGYAYMQRGTKNANLLVHTRSSEGFPKIEIQVEVFAKRRYTLAQYGLRLGGFFGKLIFLAMALLGAPVSLAGTVRRLASDYLPPQYEPTITIVDKLDTAKKPPPGFAVTKLK